jgi:GAF domain-containing protein/anti-sigma regulatory factor (Ser/Thr protein kinase)
LGGAADLERELAEARAREAALAEVLRSMSSSPTDVQPVLDAIATSAARFCGAEDACVMLEEEGELRLAAHVGPVPFTRPFGYPIDRESMNGRAFIEGRVLSVSDIQTAVEYPRGAEQGLKYGWHSSLVAPLMRGPTAIGTIVLRRIEVQPFSDRQIELLVTFADQAVIALENVRLSAATNAALERQIAISQILEAMSQSTKDLSLVFTTIIRNVVLLCQADNASIFGADGDVYRHVASATSSGRFADEALFARLPVAAASGRLVKERSTLVGRVLIAKATVQIVDILADTEYDSTQSLEFMIAMAGQNARTILGVPIVKGAALLGVVVARRNEVRAFTDREINVLETFARQAAIAIENTRLFHETTEALERQTATAEILRAISNSPTDVQPVLEAIAANARRFCGAEDAGVLLVRDDMVTVGAHDGPVPPSLHSWPADRRTVSGRSIVERQTVHIADLQADPDDEFPIGRQQALELGERTVLATPLLREGEPLGAIVLRRFQVKPFTDRQIDLVRTFADQAVIAIENVRLFNETKEALEQQTATSEVLKVISTSTSELQPVFEALVRKANDLCDAEWSLLWLRRDDGFHLAAGFGIGEEFLASQRDRVEVVGRGSIVGRTALEGRPIHLPDILADPEYIYPEDQRLSGFRTVLGVPIRREHEVIGVIALDRNDVRPFSDTQIRLVQTFADQAAIAIENVRLFNETKEALERQTATSEILRAISRSPTDVQPVLDTILANALRLCDAHNGGVFDFDGEAFRVRATAGVSPEFGAYLQGAVIRPGRETPLRRVALERRPVHVADVFADPGFAPPEIYRREGMRTSLAIPLLKENTLVGALTFHRREVRPFTEQQIALLQTFADQAVIAIENVRLFNETKETLERETATAEVLRVTAQSIFELQPVLDAVIANATRLAGAENGFVYQVDGPVLRMTAAVGEKAELMREWQRTNPIRADDRGTATGRSFVEGRTVHLPDVFADPKYHYWEAQQLGNFRTLLSVPLVRQGTAVGVIAMWRTEEKPFTEKEINLVETFADQAVIAIENVRLFNEIQDKSRQLEVASKHKSEFLANMSHELRTPLNAVIGFSEVLLERMFGELNARQDEYLHDILSSGRHLLTLINDILDLAKIEAGRVDLEPGVFSLRTALENGVTMVRERASRHGIAVEMEIGADLESVSGDERKVKQVVYNLLSNAVKFTPDGGRVAVRAARENGAVQVTVRDTGIGIAADDQDRIFEEFSQVGRDPERSREGTGLGLTLAKRYVELHGGRLWVESAPGQGSAFTFTLPQP